MRTALLTLVILPGPSIAAQDPTASKPGTAPNTDGLPPGMTRAKAGAR